MGIITYLKETKTEFKHVNWPTRAQTIKFTLIVIGISLFVAALLGFFDYVFSLGIKALIG